MLRDKKLLTSIVTSLALIFGQSVLSLHTGYTYDKTPVSSAALHADLKCGFMFNELTHLRLVNLLMTEETFQQVPPSETMEMIGFSYSRAMVHALINIEGMKIGPLWPLHFYTKIAIVFYRQCIEHANDEQKKITIGKLLDTNSYVLGLLQKEVENNCRGGNKFNSYDRWYQDCKNTEAICLDRIKLEVMRNFSAIRHMLNKNKFPSTDNRQYIALNLKELLMNNFGNNLQVLSDLMYVYNVQVIWHNTITQLHAAWARTKEMQWSTNKLSHIKVHYDLYFDFLKVFIVRLSWKYLLQIKDYTGSIRENYAVQWYFLVVDFKKLLNMHGDPHIEYLLVAIDNLAKAQESIVNIIYCLEDILRTITPPLECVATDPMNLDGAEFKVPYKSMDQSLTKYFMDMSRPRPIERNGLANTKLFLSHLRVIFSEVDFGLIRLFLDYINEINQ